MTADLASLERKARALKDMADYRSAYLSAGLGDNIAARDGFMDAVAEFAADTVALLQALRTQDGGR